MKNKKRILIGIFIAALLIIVFVIFISSKINRSSFIVKITGNFTSSGAKRDYNASLTFVDNILVEGTEFYYVLGQGNYESINGCKVINGQWIDSTDGSNCKIDEPFIPAVTKEGIEKQIRRKKLVPISKCGHADLCYEILDLSHINDGKPGGPGGSMGNQNN